MADDDEVYSIDTGAVADEARTIALRLIAAATSRTPGRYLPENRPPYLLQLEEALAWASGPTSGGRARALLDALALFAWVGVCNQAERDGVDEAQILARMQQAIEDQVGPGAATDAA